MIGVFDSGVGGLSVWREMIKLMPGERFVYVSDSGHCPYGPKPREEVIKRSCKITEYLIERGADMIVVACNTATAAAIEYLRTSYTIPFVGMEPAVKPAALNTSTGVIGVLATQGTFKGELYLRTLHKFAVNATVIEQIGEGLVELVEEGKTNTPAAKELLKKYLIPMMERHADHLVLGCTHYPFLIEAIQNIIGDKMIIVNPAPAVAKWVKEVADAQMEGERADTNVMQMAEDAHAEKGCVKKECGTALNEFVTTGNNIELIRTIVHSIVPDCADKYIYNHIAL
ncbi:MAG: glutamate racemase [Bacteroidales bacterium]